MFHVVVQQSKTVQIGLLSSLLHIPKEEIIDVEIGNPIAVGAAVSDKTFILDTKITLNNNEFINIEMQVSGRSEWTDRSLLYLCRAFDNVAKGQAYDSVYPVTHIGIVDFRVFKGDEEFYAQNRLMNMKTHRIYNSKFRLNVLSLKNIKNATEEDKKWNLDLWARLFKAKTWEEIKMLCKENPEFEETTKLIFKMNEDDKVREQCQQREDYEKHERTMQHRIDVAEARAEQEKARAEQEKARADDAEARVDDAEARISSMEKEMMLLKKQIEELQTKE